MSDIQPFKALRPEAQLAKSIASKPYDVLSSKEAKIEAQGNPNSFLHITKSEIDLPETIDSHSQQVYDKAKENLTAFISRKLLFREDKPCYYLYRLTMNKISQTGLVCVSSVEDYENDLIKKHEFTRPEKEKDRIDHMITIGAQTGNVFLAYRDVPEMNELVNKWITAKNPQYDFIADDKVQHSIWIISDDATIKKITQLFKTKVPATYIADGHHRAASASKVKQKLGSKAPDSASYFLTTLFPANQLRIMDYNRLVKDLKGLSVRDFISKLSTDFDIAKSEDPFKPSVPHEFGMYLEKQWYSLRSKPGTFKNDPIGILDVSILQ